jgi:hypothetical protein
MPIQPIFLFSIPRSGSTLIQRIIASHDGVSTASEPWLLLPHAYTMRPSGVDAEYVHPLMVTAIEDFCERLPAGREDYEREMREFVLRLYEKAAGPGARYFLDKTPPYCLIAGEIMRLFPDAKFIFLWRNPLSVIASIVETWEPWKPTLFREDLFVGLPRLLASHEQAGSRGHAVRFEDLLAGDVRQWSALMSYLDIEFKPSSLERFSELELDGRMGDPTGVKRYATLNDEPRQKWKQTLSNPVRKEWCRRYLAFLGDERLTRMGYDRQSILAELDAEPSSSHELLADVGRLIKDVAKEPLRVRTRNRRLGGPNVIRELI